MHLAPYACDPEQSRGRLYAEEESLNRTPFQRDRDRIIHSTAFRRLKHKTQVFIYHEGDHYRTRLTHSIEVAQIARTIARSLGLNEDLAEATALAHDFGHTPFGHAGEDALNEAMADLGGFDHNAQTLRLVTLLEKRYAAFDGLNLTWETLEGLAKHNGPLVDAPIDHKAPPKSLPFGFAHYLPHHDLHVHTWPSAEAQVAAIADDIAYCNHDIDDGLRAELIDFDGLRMVPLVAEVLDSAEPQCAEQGRGVLIHETVRQLIGLMVHDVTDESRRRLEALQADHPDAVREAEGPTVGFSDEMNARIQALRAFLFENVYRHYVVNRMTQKSHTIVKELFGFYLGNPNCLPDPWRRRAGEPQALDTARVVADFVAGMTDRFAIREYQKLFDLSPFSL